MKYAVLIGDGMADFPLEELNGRTPLEAAMTPNMDGIAREGQLGLVATIPHGFSPASDVAILSILGYDPRKYYNGRAPLEAAELGIELKPGEIAFRCNLITAAKGRIADYSGGHITTGEAAELINCIQQQLGTESVKFYPGVSYRHICVIKSNDPLQQIKCVGPHDVIGQPIEDHLPHGAGARQLIDLMERSYALLSAHEVNKNRVSRGQNPANMIWLWGQGSAPQMPAFRDCYGVGGGVITAVDLVKGIAKLIGLKSINVPGATGYYDTNYEAKASYALKCLEKEDFVLVHVEAPDEASHNADIKEKIRAIENFDHLIVGPVRRWLDNRTDARILVLPDHATPIKLRTHAADPVPFACWGRGIESDKASEFSERIAARSTLRVNDAHILMERFIKN